MKPHDSILEFYRTASTGDLMKKAAEGCLGVHGRGVWVRGIIEISNVCLQDCLYCGIRRENRKVRRYRISHDEVIKTIKQYSVLGIKTFVLQSGELAGGEINDLKKLIENIRSETAFDAETAITVSCGVMKKSDYRELKEAGADRYLLRFETSDEGLFRYIKHGQELSSRINALTDLKELDYQVGSGFMVGLPGETDETRIQNALLCRKMELDMIGIGPFIPHPDTPLAAAKQKNIELTLRMTALLRLLMPETHLPATTAAGSLDPLGRENMILAGANVWMPNVTPLEYRAHYLLYPGKICVDEEGTKCVSCVDLRLRSIGRYVKKGRGDSIRKIREEEIAL